MPFLLTGTSGHQYWYLSLCFLAHNHRRCRRRRPRRRPRRRRRRLVVDSFCPSAAAASPLPFAVCHCLFSCTSPGSSVSPAVRNAPAVTVLLQLPFHSCIAALHRHTLQLLPLFWTRRHTLITGAILPRAVISLRPFDKPAAVSA